MGCRVVGDGRGRWAAVVALVGLWAVPGAAVGQTAPCAEVVAAMAAQQRAIGIVRALDYQIREHFLLEANAILSTYGGWNSIDRANATNASKFWQNTVDFRLQAQNFKRDMARGAATDADVKAAFDSAVDDYLGLIETGDRIARAIQDGRVDDANRLYFEAARPAYISVHGVLYTLITTAERRVAALARAPCG